MGLPPVLSLGTDPLTAPDVLGNKDHLDFEIGVPVTNPVAPAGRVRPAAKPATAVIRTIYSGPYEGLGAAWSEFDAWIAAEGLAPAPDLWERYLEGPESDSDPTKWRTELNRPLIR